MRVFHKRGMPRKDMDRRDGLAKEYHRINDHRVRIVHGLWAHSATGVTLSRGSSGKKHNPEQFFHEATKGAEG
jgi:hypothetical protein